MTREERSKMSWEDKFLQLRIMDPGIRLHMNCPGNWELLTTIYVSQFCFKDFVDEATTPEEAVNNYWKALEHVYSFSTDFYMDVYAAGGNLLRFTFSTAENCIWQILGKLNGLESGEIMQS